MLDHQHCLIQFDKYWSLSRIKLMHKKERSCNICFKRKISGPSQLMGKLPLIKIQLLLPFFMHKGINYCGPLLISLERGKG
jgi:hypothetical protein